MNIRTILIAVSALLLTACSEGEHTILTRISHALASFSGQPSSDSTQSNTEIVVYKSPTCGCCQEWVNYLDKNGFVTKTIDHDNADSIKAQLGLTDPELKSCHTAVVGDYIIEGHVPVSDIRRLLSEKPPILGLSAPGMPVMSPGMGSEDPIDYDVVAFGVDNTKVSIFSSY